MVNLSDYNFTYNNHEYNFMWDPFTAHGEVIRILHIDHNTNTIHIGVLDYDQRCMFSDQRDEEIDRAIKEFTLHTKQMWDEYLEKAKHFTPEKVKRRMEITQENCELHRVLSDKM